MKISQKRTCSGCRALQDGTCEFHYKTKDAAPLGAFIRRIRPTEPCPKPITTSEYIDALRIHKWGAQ